MSSNTGRYNNIPYQGLQFMTMSRNISINLRTCQCIHCTQGYRATGAGTTVRWNVTSIYQFVTCPHEMCNLTVPIDVLSTHARLMHRSYIRFGNVMFYSISTHQFTTNNSFMHLQAFNGFVYVVKVTKFNMNNYGITLQYIPEFEVLSPVPAGTIKLLNANNSVISEIKTGLTPYGIVSEETLIRSRHYVAVTLVMTANFFAFTVLV